jgi:uncharacterized protein YjbI with pentapeptide repeats
VSERVWKPAEIRRRFEHGERDFRRLEIEDDELSFRDAVLDGADFSHAFVVADFSRASLRGCRFHEANVKTCLFDEADLHGADFTGAALDATSFRDARTTDATFTDAHIQGQSLRPGERPS